MYIEALVKMGPCFSRCRGTYCLCRHSFSTPPVQGYSSIGPGHRNRSRADCLVSLAACFVGRGTPGHWPTLGPRRGPPGPKGQKHSLSQRRRWHALRCGERPFGRVVLVTGSPGQLLRSARPQIAPSPEIGRRLLRQTLAPTQQSVSVSRSRRRRAESLVAGPLARGGCRGLRLPWPPRKAAIAGATLQIPTVLPSSDARLRVSYEPTAYRLGDEIPCQIVEHRVGEAIFHGARHLV